MIRFAICSGLHAHIQARSLRCGLLLPVHRGGLRPADRGAVWPSDPPRQPLTDIRVQTRVGDQFRGPQQWSLEARRRPRDRHRRVHRLVRPPTPARRDRADPTRRARRQPLPSQQRTDDRRRVSCAPPLNPGRDTARYTIAHIGSSVTMWRWSRSTRSPSPMTVSHSTVRSQGCRSTSS